ncbi:hypothetical protein M0R45_022619 [Rubus argutus]|uniref:Cytosine-specific methyltransferase n=1 Tax=Rubus argutus TaxID=59490 RepID=A0AAW1XI99_RUBAR
MATKPKKKSKASPASTPKSKKPKTQRAEAEATASSMVVDDGKVPEPRFVGKPIKHEEARRRWSNSYSPGKEKQVPGTKGSNGDEASPQARYHFKIAEVDGVRYDLYDDAHVKAGDGEPPYICKIVEMFEAVDGVLYFTAQWYYRVQDTVIKDCVNIDRRRIFFSEVKDHNPLECLLEKITIVRLALNVDPDVKSKLIPECKYYCDTKYLISHSTFVNLPPEDMQVGSQIPSTISSEVAVRESCKVNSELVERSIVKEQCKEEVKLLDLYSGCGGMSTGLCLGANLSNVNLVTRWAVDLNEHALKSLKLNHPETEVRNESAEDFLMLLKKWKGLCIYFNMVESNDSETPVNLFAASDAKDEGEDDDDQNKDNADDSEVYEVENILEICYGKPQDKKRGLYFKVHWKGYGSDEDSWEPIESLRDCRESVQKFVSHGYKSKMLPLPGDVDMVCGGPPCQGISGFNRFRDKKNPFKDVKNEQLVVFMDIVQYLKPKYVLMENVVDLLKFAEGFLGRYAIGRLVDMNYQARMGMMCAGAYGLPQFRMRVFLWGTCPTERLPQYPLPTYDVVVKGRIPTEWEENAVYSEEHHAALKEKLFLVDALSDLPAVENSEDRDEMPYGSLPQTEFQKMIRLSRNYLLGSSKSEPYNMTLYDHRPLKVNDDDYARICLIPKEKGANFRNLTGVQVRPDKTVEWDPNVDRVYLDSGKPLVPDYAMTFVHGKSSKPFGRLWWDEIVSTVVTRAEPHNQVILHPLQDRVLTIRENARLQGFPDYYKLCGPVKERYIQVGNAVAVPVARALGYALGRALNGCADDCPVFELPHGFPNHLEVIPSP